LFAHSAIEGFLLVYHVILKTEDLTTNEKLKRTYKGTNPYSRGVWKNLQHRWCGFFPTRYIKMHVTEMEDLSAPVFEEDLELENQCRSVKVEL
jgi:hypothetical protein